MRKHEYKTKVKFELFDNDKIKWPVIDSFECYSEKEAFEYFISKHEVMQCGMRWTDPSGKKHSQIVGLW